MIGRPKNQIWICRADPHAARQPEGVSPSGPSSIIHMRSDIQQNQNSSELNPSGSGSRRESGSGLERNLLKSANLHACFRSNVFPLHAFLLLIKQTLHVWTNTQVEERRGFCLTAAVWLQHGRCERFKKSILVAVSAALCRHTDCQHLSSH